MTDCTTCEYCGGCALCEDCEDGKRWKEKENENHVVRTPDHEEEQSTAD